MTIEDKERYENLEKRNITLGTVLSRDSCYFLFLGKRRENFVLERLKKTPFVANGYKRKSSDAWWLEDGLSSLVAEKNLDKFRVEKQCKDLLPKEDRVKIWYMDTYEKEKNFLEELKPFNMYLSGNKLFMYDDVFLSAPVTTGYTPDFFMLNPDRIRIEEEFEEMQYVCNAYSKELETFVLKWRLTHDKK